MQRGFTKLFNTIVTSTIWQEDDKTRIVWITMLAIADAFGNVFAAIPGLASVSNVSIDACEKAVENLLAPDPYSRTKDHEGRRIYVIDGGWHVINYPKYRKMMDEEERKDYKAKWARENRRQKRTNVDNSGHTGTENRLCGHIPSASLFSFLKEGVRGRFDEWMKVRRGMKKSKDFESMFVQQAEWLKDFTEQDQLEIINQSIRNGWQGLFPPKREKKPYQPEKKPDPRQARLDREFEEAKEKYG